VIANTAFLAMLTVFLLVGWFADQVSFLAPYKAGLFHHYGWTIVLGILLVFLNLCALYYALARALFLRDAGRKLSHVDRQFSADAGLDEPLRAQLRAKGW